MVLYFILAVVFLLSAYMIKILRQAQFIEIYEQPPKNILGKALSITFLLNLVLPLRLGNIFRMFYTGKHLKNGKSFALATILIDLLLDLFTVSLVFVVLYIIGLVSKSVFLFFSITLVSILLVIVLSMILSKPIKKLILICCGIFNKSIKLKLLKSSWCFITSFKDMLKKINKWKLLLFTLLSTGLFLLSFFCFSLFFGEIGSSIAFVDIYSMLYANLFAPLLYVLYKGSNLMEMLYFAIYMLVPIVFIYFGSYIYKTKFVHKTKEKHYLELLPHVKSKDRLVFLEKYFSSKQVKYFKDYLRLNQDIAIIEDYSAGSNATTMLCSKDGKTFYRKYAFGDDAEKLYEQANWINEHKDKLTLTKIENLYYKKGVCCYDMPYVSGSTTCFNFVHTRPFRESWKNIKSALDDIDANLHTINRREADKNTIEKYIDSKVLANIEKIKQGEFIKPLLKYDYIFINGKKYHNLQYFEKYLNKDYLYEVFKNDSYSNIHGDFTIENIICLKDDIDKKGYYIIDPNTGNLHDSPYLDYSKLLQSIHGGYEFLMKTKSVSSIENKIDFLFTKSNTYYRLFNNFVEYLTKKFGQDGVKSIFYHEIIHWLRLMPYKINKIGENSLLFYSGLIMVMTDVEEMFEGKWN